MYVYVCVHVCVCMYVCVQVTNVYFCVCRCVAFTDAVHKHQQAAVAAVGKEVSKTVRVGNDVECVMFMYVCT